MMGTAADARRVRFRVIACMLLLAMWQVATLAAGMKFGLAGLADFRAFYGAGTMVRTGEGTRLYDYGEQHRVQNDAVGARTAALPFVYPAYAAVPFAPLSRLSYRGAYLTFFGVNVGLLGMAVWMMLPWLGGLRRVWGPLPWLVFGCFYPVAIALLQGQVSLALLAVFCGCLALLERRREGLAGAVLALGLVKFNLVLPVVLLYLLWRRWRFIGGFAAGAVGVGMVSVAVCGWGGMVAYARAMGLAAGTGSVGAVQDDSMRVSARMPDLHGLVYAVAGDAGWGAWVTVALSLAVLGWTAWRGRSFARAVVAALLVSFHLHLHDLSLLLIPVGMVLAGVCEGVLEGRRVERVVVWVAFGAGVLLMLSPGLTWLSGRGLNGVMAVLMVPLLLGWEAASGQAAEAEC